MKREDNKKLIVYFLLILNIFILFYFGMKKSAFNVDEIYTSTLSNSYFNPFISIKENQPLTKDYFLNYLTVQPGEEFSFSSVYYNQTKDVHPPLYYFLFHALSSLTVSTFSKWTGLILNLFFFILTWSLLYNLTRKYYNNTYLPLIVPFIWGTSVGTISSFVFIRMYVMFTFFVTLTVYLHAKMIIENKISIKKLLSILLVTFLGFMTHYYFIVFAFFLSFATVLIFILYKRFKMFIYYCITMISSLILSYLYYPYLIDHIFYGYRGEQAFENISTINNFIDNIMTYIHIINKSLFSNYSWILLILFLVMVFKLFLSKNIKLFDFKLKNKWSILFLMIVSSSGYIIIISQVAPYESQRYLSPIFPILTLLIIYLLYDLGKRIKLSKKSQFILFSTLLTIHVGMTLLSDNIGFLYNDSNSERVEKIIADEDTLGILIYNDRRVRDAQITKATQNLVDHSTSYILNSEDYIKQINNLNLDSDSVIIYFGYPLDADEFTEEIVQNTDFSGYELIDEYAKAYYFK